MDPRLRQRTVYPTYKQKRKLIALVSQHPQLISFKVSQNFNTRDSQALWGHIAAECNTIPGARKTWRQWRKTWQDIRANAKKKQQVRNGEIPTSIENLTVTEIEALGLKNVSSTTNYQDTVEFVAPEDTQDLTAVDNLTGYNDQASYSPPGSPPEVKAEVLTLTQPQLKYPLSKVKKMKTSNNSSHSDSCVFNCDKLAVQEQRKVQIKEDYLNFKKDYLRQKLLLMKEQTEALKGIAKELAK